MFICKDSSMSTILAPSSFSPEDRKIFEKLIDKLYKSDFEKPAELIQLYNLLTKYNFKLEDLKNNPEWLLGVLPQNIETLKTLEIELAEEKQGNLVLQSNMKVLQEEKDYLQKRMDVFNRISEKIAPLSKHVKPLSKVVTTPLYYTANIAGGPLSAAIHHYTNPQIFSDDSPTPNSGEIAFGYLMMTIAGTIFWTAVNLADMGATKLDINKQIEAALTDIPCTAQGNRTGACDAVHIPLTPYYLPFLPFSGEGLGPYTLERSLEVKTENTVNDSGIKGFSTCHQYKTYLRDAFDRVDESTETQPSRTVHPWVCRFDPA